MPVSFAAQQRSLRSSRPSPAICVALLAVLLVGLAARELAFNSTKSIRFELNQKNAFYWGDRIVHGDGLHSGPVSWSAFWHSYVNTYDDNETHPPPAIHTLDYVPLRLLMAGVWVNYLNRSYGPVSEWRPEFARSFAAFSMVMELAAAAAMFLLVARYLNQVETTDSFSHRRDRWKIAAAAASLIWLNPASIVDSHVWPHGQTWILPFYLGAMLMMIEHRYLLAGIAFGIGAMFKGQMLMIAPLLILWPLFDRRWLAAGRVIAGMAIGVGVIVWPWASHGDFAWLRAGFGATGIYSDVLRKGVALNLPAVLDKLGMTLHQPIVDCRLAGREFKLELRGLLVIIYAGSLACCAAGIARQARTGDRRLLTSLATPWALMFFLLGQMDERYLVWSACFSAAAIAVDRRSLAAHLSLSVAGAATMLEFLLLATPLAHPTLLHALIQLNPVTWLLTAAAVAMLFANCFTTKIAGHPAQPKPTLSKPLAALHLLSPRGT